LAEIAVNTLAAFISTYFFIGVRLAIGLDYYGVVNYPAG
jgi:hypothetical protein